MILLFEWLRTEKSRTKYLPLATVQQAVQESLSVEYYIL